MNTEEVALDNISFLALAVLGSKEMYGYQIAKKIKSDFEPGMTIATFYRRMRRLEKNGFVEVVPGPFGDKADPRRKYFRLTEDGLRLRTQEYKRKYRYTAKLSTLFLKEYINERTEDED